MPDGSAVAEHDRVDRAECGRVRRDRVEVFQHELFDRVGDVDAVEPGQPGRGEDLADRARRAVEFGEVEQAVLTSQPELVRLALVQGRAQGGPNSRADQADEEGPESLRGVTVPLSTAIMDVLDSYLYATRGPVGRAESTTSLQWPSMEGGALGAHASGAAVATPTGRNAERTRSEILAVASHEFADKGYAGARVDEIAAKTRTTKRMIYYYFGGKEQLYIAVLEHAYTGIRALEQQLDVEHLDPAQAIRRLAAVTFDHHEAHPDFIRLVSIENIHRAEHLARSDVLAGLANPALDVLTRILERGRAEAGSGPTSIRSTSTS
ncbi:hypothetical protein GCM10027614_00550 [Micromonospora vulcania]